MLYNLRPSRKREEIKMEIDEKVTEIEQIRKGGNKVVLGNSLDAIPCWI